MLHAGRGRHHEALEEFGVAEAPGIAAGRDSQALASAETGWLLATQARLGMTGEARAFLAALDDERAGSGEIRNARAVICLAEGDPAAALAAVADVLDGTAPISVTQQLLRRTCWPGSPIGISVTSARPARRRNAQWLWRSLTGWSCRSR